MCRPIFTELLSVFFDDGESETCLQRSAGCRDVYELQYVSNKINDSSEYEANLESESDSEEE